MTNIEKRAIELLDKYSYRKIVFDSLPFKDKIYRAWFLIYLVPFISIYLYMIINHIKGLSLIINFSVLFLFVLDIFLDSINFGIYNHFRTKCLNAELRLFKVKSKESLYQKLNNIQATKIFSELKKEYPHLERAEIFSIIQEKLNTPKLFSRVIKRFSIILFSMTSFLLNNLFNKYNFLDVENIKYIGVLLIFFLLYLFSLILILSPLKDLVNKEYNSYLKLRELLFISNFK